MNKRKLNMTYTDGALTRIELPNGYVSPEGIRYYIKDYQGNIRQVVDSVGTVLQENHYYPFGMVMGESSDIIEANRFGRWADAVSNPYRYGGNRLLTLRNAHIGDFNARWYDFQTCRFLQQDPLKEKYYPYSPYLYCLANPIMSIDPTGNDTWTFDKYGRITNHTIDNKKITSLNVLIRMIIRYRFIPYQRAQAEIPVH